jgi:ubiquinone/menaquinone biosynthesis C-methylase UbiE
VPQRDHLDINHAVYLDEKVCRSYLNLRHLFPVEVEVIKQLRELLPPQAKILDLGIGTGRTTPHLLSLSKDYVGLDYSSEMVTLAKQNFPHLRIAEGDARDLTAFENRTFDLVFFSYNGLDYVNHSDRLVALTEINRVLRPAGIFVFSSHNADYSYFDKLRITWQPFHLRNIYYNVQSLKNRMMNRSAHQYERDYAIITDPGHNYRLLTYYISPAKQKLQLAAAGFTDTVKVFDIKGNEVEMSKDSSWLYYLTFKK